MRNTSGAKYLLVFALLLSVAALSLGFAAFTSTLTIKSSAEYTAPNEFNLKFSTTNSGITTGSVTPTLSPSTGTVKPTGQSATLSDTTIQGLKATFTDTNQSVKYSFYAYNASEFLGYLNSVSIGTKTCTPGRGTTASFVTQACNGISLSVKVGSNTYTSSNTNISSHTLAKNTGEAIEVTIAYADGAQKADGDFTVTFGDTTLIYGTAD